MFAKRFLLRLVHLWPGRRDNRPRSVTFQCRRGCAEHDGSKPTFLAYQLMVGSMLEANGRPAFDCAPILKELVEHYQNEVGNSG